MISPTNELSINFAVDTLNKGEIIAYPTDTLYGFGVDATNDESITKLNQLKGRTQPLSIIIANLSEIQKYAIISGKNLKKISEYLPGPFTFLIKKRKSILSDLVTYGSEFIGIRIPNHKFPLKLVERLKKPLITTSINKNGHTPLNKIEDIENNYPEIKIFEDKNQNNISSNGSTIIMLDENNIKLIRQGDGIFKL